MQKIQSEISFKKRHKGLFINYVYKKEGFGSQKMSIFVNIDKVESVNRVSGQKKPKPCQRSL